MAALDPPRYLLAREGQRHISRSTIVFLRARYDRKHRSLLLNLKWRIETMTDLIQLTDAEIAGVSGGILNQSISISASQTNNATVKQTATATNNGAVTASISANGGATGVGDGGRRRP